MHSSLKTLFVAVVVFSSLAWAVPEGEVVIRTRDGKVRMGKVLSETSKGYLLAGPDGTQVVEFTKIIEIRQLAGSTPEPVASPLPPPPPPPQAQPAPVVQAASPTPPPPSRPAEAPVQQVIEQQPVIERNQREGIHFGLGAGGMALPGSAMAHLQAHLEFNFGRPVYRISANGGFESIYGRPFVLIAVDNLFQFNVTDVYAFGVGVEVGLFTGGMTHLFASPVVQPVIIKLGERGQHQISLTGSIVLISSYDDDPFTGRPTAINGTPQVFLGYSYFF